MDRKDGQVTLLDRFFRGSCIAGTAPKKTGGRVVVLILSACSGECVSVPDGMAVICYMSLAPRSFTLKGFPFGSTARQRTL
jgi:hypothetical protein